MGVRIMFNVFGFLRSQAGAAVLGGISDALAEVSTDDAPADLDALRKRLAAAGEVKAIGAKLDAEPADAGEASGRAKRAK